MSPSLSLRFQAPSRLSGRLVSVLSVVSVMACGTGDGGTKPSGSGASGSGASGSGASGSGASGSGAFGSGAFGGGGATGTGGEGRGASGAVPVGTGGAPPNGNVFDAGSEPGRNRVQPGQVCERLSTVQCAGESACCGDPGRTFDQCKAVMREVCVTEIYMDVISAHPVTGYSIDTAEAAFTEFERLASVCDPNIALWGISPAGLRGIAAGTVPPGGDCTPPITALRDQSQAAAYLAACQDVANFGCLPGTLTWTCEPRGPVGAPCFSDVNCMEGHYCPNPGPNFALTGKTCLVRKPAGQPCGLPSECQSLQCRSGTCQDAPPHVAYCL